MNGFVLYRGPSLIGDGDIVAIATLESKNEKTGDMVQVWILPEHDDPLAALHNGTNDGVCGNCPLQGTRVDGRMENRVCYVNLGQAPLGIWRAYKRGSYPMFNRAVDQPMLEDREIRIGAYGDPAALPTSLVKYLASVGSSWTGYSHQLFWIDQRRAKALAKYLMASCHTKAMDAEARRRGWRPFTAIAEGQTPPENSVHCPHYTHGVQCRDCLLCQGTSKNAKAVYVIAHAKTGYNLPKVQHRQGASL